MPISNNAIPKLTQAQAYSHTHTAKELPHIMTWTDGIEEVVKLTLAATVGALGQRLYLQSKLHDLDSKVGQLEKEVVELKAHAANAVTKIDLARESTNLQTIMELKLGNLSTNLHTLTTLVQRVLDRPSDYK